MPNYGLIIDSTYNPMSFEQYAAPFDKYAKVYNEMADQYDALEMEANKWEKLAESAVDQKEYKQYQTYAAKLRAAADDLAENGLSTSTRNTLSSLRGEYAKTIQPISDAWDTREKERELQRQALLQNPDIMFSRDAANTGLSAYMSGTPALQTYNGARLYEYTSKAVEQLAQAAREDLMENGANSEWYKILGGQYYQKDNYKGVTPDVVMQSMFDAEGNLKPEANKYLASVAEGAIDLSGMRNWSNWNDIASRAYNYVNQGLWGAIGSEQEKQLSNKYWDYLQKQEETNRLAAMNNTSIPINPKNIYSRKVQAESEKIYKDNKKYITEDSEGNWAYSNNNDKIKYSSTGEPYTIYNHDSKLVNIFISEWKKHTGETFTFNEANQYMSNPQHSKTVGNLLKKYFNEVLPENKSYDATRYTEYNFAYDSDKQKEIKDSILPLLQEVNLQAVDWDNEKNTYSVTGEELSAQDLADATILESSFSRVNGVNYTVLSIKHKDGSIGTYKMPVGINRQNEEARDKSLEYAENTRIELAKIAKDPNTINPRTGKPYTENEISNLRNIYNNHVQNAYKGHSQIGLKYKTQTVTFPGYGY